MAPKKYARLWAIALDRLFAMLKNLDLETFYHAVSHYCDILNIDESMIEFEFSNLRRSTKLWGACTNDIDCVTIEIDKGLSRKNTLKTLAHELVHAKQFLEGELDCIGDYWIWHGEIVLESYEDEPHEIEANSLESVLYSSFMESMR